MHMKGNYHHIQTHEIIILVASSYPCSLYIHRMSTYASQRGVHTKYMMQHIHQAAKKANSKQIKYPCLPAISVSPPPPQHQHCPQPPQQEAALAPYDHHDHQ